MVTGSKRLSTETGDGPLCVLTGNYTIPHLFARGLLVTPEWGIESETAFLDEHPDSFLSTTGTVPFSWSEGIENSARNSFPILIQLKPGHAIRWLKQDPPSFAYLSLADVERLVFRSEREMKRFSAWRFENYVVSCPLVAEEDRFEQAAGDLADGLHSGAWPPGEEGSRGGGSVAPSEDSFPSLDGEGLSLDIKSGGRDKVRDSLNAANDNERDGSPKLPDTQEAESRVQAEGTSSSLEGGRVGAPAVERQQPESRRRAFKRAEAIAGTLAAFARLMPGTREWMEAIRAFGASGSVESIETGPSAWIDLAHRTLIAKKPLASDNVENLLMSVAVDVLLTKSMSDGWPARTVLDDIVATGRQHATVEGGTELIRQLDKWQARAGDVLEQRVGALDLSDDPSKTVRRALMLLLLRGDLEALEQTPAESNGPLKVGRDVKALATCLAAIRYGLRGLPSRVKTGGETGETALAVFGEQLIEKYARLMDLDAKFVGGSLDVKYERLGDLEGRWLLLCAGRQFDSRRAVFDRELKILFEKAKILGLEPRQEREGESTLCMEAKIEDRSFLVRMSLIGGTRAEKKIVRFWVEVVPQVGEGTRKSRRVSKWKLKKSDLEELLVRNGDVDMHCRYALVRDTQQLIVLTDQLFHTLDDSEYRMHVKVVSEAANHALKSLLPQK